MKGRVSVNYTITNRYGFSLLTDVKNNKTLVTVPTALDEAIVFSIIAKFDDYETASLAVLAMHEGGLKPADFISGEEQDDGTDEETIEGETLAVAGGVREATA